MSWITEINSGVNSLKSNFNALKNNVQSKISINTSRTRDMISSYFNNGYTVVGINAEKIPAMKTAIEGYVTTINNELAKLNNYNPEVAFKGSEIVPALKEYIEAVKELCGNIVSHMLAFRDQLDVIYTAYTTRDANTASSLRTEATNAREAQQAYTGPSGN